MVIFLNYDSPRDYFYFHNIPAKKSDIDSPQHSTKFRLSADFFVDLIRVSVVSDENFELSAKLFVKKILTLAKFINFFSNMSTPLRRVDLLGCGDAGGR